VPILLIDGLTPKDLTVLSADVFKELNGRLCLFILDNADNEEEVKQTLSTIKDHYFLLTSRYNFLM